MSAASVEIAGEATDEVLAALHRLIPQLSSSSAPIAVAELRAINALPGPHDLWIAASALQYGVPLVTRNLAQFQRIEGLRLESY